MTTRNQNRKIVEELVSQDSETPIAENNLTENLVAGPSKSKIHLQNLDEIKTSLRKEIISDLAKIPAEHQRKILKLIPQLFKKSTISQNAEDSDSETEKVFLMTASTPTKSETITH